jgi:hypothetical protein
MDDRQKKILQYVQYYAKLGMYVIPIPPGTKKPVLDEWQDLRLSIDELSTLFGDAAYNVAMILGIDNLADVDADTQEAIRAAHFFLPETEFEFGRPSKLRSHRFYWLTAPLETIQLRDPIKQLDPATNKEKSAMVIELRCLTKEQKVGLITVVPPSLHPSGEEIRFTPGTRATAGPPTIDGNDLANAVYRTGSAGLLAAYWPTSGGGRHECMLALSGTLARAGWPEDDTVNFCNAVYRSLPDPDANQFERVSSEVNSTYKKHRDKQTITGVKRLEAFVDPKVVKAALGWLGIKVTIAESNKSEEKEVSAATESKDGKTVIELSDKDQERITTDTLEALYRNNKPPKLFTQRQSIVEIAMDKKNNITIRDVRLKHQIHQAARFTRDGKSSNMSPDLPQDILSMSAHLLEFPELNGIIRCPVMRRDGSIIESAGYDSPTGLLKVEDDSLLVPPVPANPTAEDASEAMLTLLHYMKEFPFTDECGRSNALAALMTPIVRPMIDACIPLGLISAVSASSGKTTLGDLISICATGRYGGYMGAPTKPEEWSKRITSTVRKGTSVNVIDNVKETQPLDSPDLCRLITDREWADREFNVLHEIRIPNEGLWLATGNNLKVGGDMATRCFLIKLDAGPDPSSRKFDTEMPHDLWRRERGLMLSASLTAARAWTVAGNPPPRNTPSTRFPEWVRVVGGILEYSGVVGFLGNYAELRASTDEEAAQWEAFHRIVRALIPGQFQIKHLLLKLETEPDFKGALPTSLRALAAKPDTLAMALGKEYSARRDRPYGKSGLKVVVLGTGHGGALKYQIVESA